MSVPNALRDNSEGYFLEEDIDVAAWISKIATDIPHPALMHQMKVVFGSPLNFETGWVPNKKGMQDDSQVCTSVKSLTGAEFLTLILKHCSLSKEQIYTQIIPYMERDDEKQLYSAAGMEHTAYMQLHHRTPAPNKGKRPLTGSLQSRLMAHAPQPAKTGESSQQ
ncbi:hypothetical protein M422DRAFT_255191 [Sphaerobolus stellatus SS14]|uniref:Uncharacterized protein n=1 Tax=Sphaerobolus stellatus (strain SS14) TaxID=990650 RepID=A0A0C9VTJ5_SPHS4|nr:hypothetical protein M422DRAFT_255187 [Sphaerobolus stellatus SS14]KIJ41865.1 hypothetical protein M422DRAFT_255191 [Sphaerobolus stellatus SS14]